MRSRRSWVATRLLLVTCAMAKADVDENPVAGTDAGALGVQQADVHRASNACDLNRGQPVVRSTISTI